jgi:hypothetical protein
LQNSFHKLCGAEGEQAAEAKIRKWGDLRKPWILVRSRGQKRRTVRIERSKEAMDP